MFGDDIYNKFTVGTLIFKRTALQSLNELEKDLNNDYSGCSEYMKLFIDIEAIIYYVMLRCDVDYNKAFFLKFFFKFQVYCSNAL